MIDLAESSPNEHVSALREMVCALSCQPDVEIEERLRQSLNALCEALALEATGVFWCEGKQMSLTAQWPVSYVLEERTEKSVTDRRRLHEIVDDESGCWMAAPMRADGAVLGRLWAVFQRDCVPDASDRELLILAANQLAMAYKKALLYQDMDGLIERRGVLLQRLMKVQEDCSLRVARDLHDEISQSLTAMIVQIDTVRATYRTDPVVSVRTLDHARSEMVRLVDEVNRVVLDLRPTWLKEKGLVAALNWYGKQRLQPTRTRFFVSGGHCAPQLSPVSRLMLYRIGQEAIANAARHAHANNVWLDISCLDGTLTLEVRDDGCGFDAQYMLDHPQGVQGLGLLGFGERALVVNGALTIQSTPGEGTAITVRMPLEENTHGGDSSCPS